VGRFSADIELHRSKDGIILEEDAKHAKDAYDAKHAPQPRREDDDEPPEIVAKSAPYRGSTRPHTFLGSFSGMR
jgi:hypothetical protein